MRKIMSQDNNKELSDALQNIQASRSTDSSTEASTDVNHDEIMSALPDDGKAGGEGLADDLGEDDKKLKAEIKSNAKPVNKIKVSKSKRKPNYLVIGGFVGVALIVAGYFVFRPKIDSSSVSLPSVSGWQLFNESKTSDSYITEATLIKTLETFRGNIVNTLQAMPSSEELAQLRQEVNALQGITEELRFKVQSIDRSLESNHSSNNIYNEPSELNVIRNRLDQLDRDVLTKNTLIYQNEKSIQANATKLEDLINSNWVNHLRIKKIENSVSDSAKVATTSAEKNLEQNITSNLNGLKSAEKVTWENSHPWVLKIASERFTQIYNTTTNKPLRVFEGADVPTCGLVIDIDLLGRKVTTQHCTITRK